LLVSVMVVCDLMMMSMNSCRDRQTDKQTDRERERDR